MHAFRRAGHMSNQVPGNLASGECSVRTFRTTADAGGRELRLQTEGDFPMMDPAHKVVRVPFITK